MREVAESESADAFGWMFAAAAAGFAVALALLLCMEEKPLRSAHPSAERTESAN
jgi:hypothetical protein